MPRCQPASAGRIAPTPGSICGSARLTCSALPEPQRLPFVSLVLVHEGVHATGILSKQWLYDEMMGEKLSIYYFRELAGPGVVNVLTGKRVWAGQSEEFDLYRTASDFLNKDQLVDYVLYHGGGLYSGPAYVTEDWIVDNLDNWGGRELAGRRPSGCTSGNCSWSPPAKSRPGPPRESRHPRWTPFMPSASCASWRASRTGRSGTR